MELFRIFGSIFLQDEEARQGLDAIDRQGASVSTRLGEMATMAGTAALSLAAVGAAAVAGIAVKGVGAAEDLHKSLNGLQASTGMSDEKMQGMHDSMLAIYNNNFGESFEDIGKSMTTIAQQSGASGEELKKLTENGLTLRDTFEFEVNESFRSAKMLMDQFGISGDEAYNLIAQGAQWGLDKNGDLLDSINEYSVHFEQIGFDSEEMFNMLVNGAASGTFSVDKLGDAMKEFGIRSKDGSTASQEAFTALGLNATQISSDFAAGGDKGKAAFELVTSKLLEMKDPLKQGQIGVSLFGTQWEDLGVKGIEALTNTEGEIGKNIDALGKINSVKYDTFGEALAGIGRQLETSVLIPVGEKLLPKLSEFAGWITSKMPEIQSVINMAMSIAFDVFDKVYKIILNLIDSVKSLTQFFKDHWEAIQPILAGIGASALTFGIYTLAINAAAIATGIWTTVTGIATVVGGAFGAVLAFITSPIGIVVIAIGLLVAAGVLLYNNWDTVKAFLGSTWEWIKSTATNVFNSILAFFTEWGPLLLSIITGPIGLLVLAISSNWDKIKGFLTAIYDWLKDTFALIFGIVKGIFDTQMDLIKTSVQIVWDFIKNNILLPVYNWLNDTFSLIFSIISTAISTAWNGLGGIVTGIWTGIKNGVLVAYNWLKDTLLPIFETIKTALTNSWDGLGGIVIGIWDGIKNTFKSGINTVIGFVNGFISKINSIKIDIPSVNIPGVGQVGGQKFGFNVPSIPMLEKGGNILDDGSILVGERGPELLSGLKGAKVTPLNKTGGITVNIVGATIFNDSDADRLGNMLVGRLRALGVGQSG